MALKIKNSKLDMKKSSLVSDQGEIDILLIWNTFTQHFWMVSGVFIFTCILSVLVALSLPVKYSSFAVLAPANSNKSSGLSSLSSRFGGLASIAGIGLPNQESKVDIAIEVARTWGFVEKFIVDHELEADLMAVSSWDSEENKLLYNEKTFDPNTNSWVDGGPPSSWNMFTSFQGGFSISKSKENGLVVVRIVHASPHVAKEWVDLFVQSLNSHFRESDKLDAQKNIGYLKEHISSTGIAEMQSVFYQLIEEQTKTLMLAEVSDEYVFKVISPARVPEVRSSPKRRIIVLIGGVLGGMFALLFVVFKVFFGSLLRK